MEVDKLGSHLKTSSVSRSGISRRDLMITEEEPRKIEKVSIARAAAEITYTLEQIEVALRNNRGSLSKAAAELNVLRPALKRKINNNPHLIRVQSDITESFIDNTEQKLMDLVDDKNVTAITFTLRTIGKERGYMEKSSVEHDIPGGISNAAALIASMRKGLEGVNEDTIIETEDYNVEGSEEWEDEETL